MIRKTLGMTIAITLLSATPVFARRFILAWIGKNLEGCENPRQFGKALSENRKGRWRYRLGDYGILAEINEDEIGILILTVWHRREIYRK